MSRTILTDEQYEEVCRAAAVILRPAGVGSAIVEEAAVAVLAAAGILTPAPDPDPDTCTAQFADPSGVWWQCEDEPGHGTKGHDGGDWGWSDTDPDARPARVEAGER